MALVKVAWLQYCGSAIFVSAFKGSKWIANSSLTSSDGTSVSGLYFNHPQARYFGISTDLGKDQLEDYAARKGIPLAVAEKWLGPWLGY